MTLSPSFTHYVCAEGMEGICSTDIQMGCVQSLQKPDMVVTLRLQRGKDNMVGKGILQCTICSLQAWTDQQRRQRGKMAETPAAHTLLFLPFFKHSACFSGEAFQSICKIKKWYHYSLGGPNKGNGGWAVTLRGKAHEAHKGSSKFMFFFCRKSGFIEVQPEVVLRIFVVH